MASPASCEFKTVHMENTYKVELTAETSSSAELTVTPGGGSTDTWFAFVSDDTTSPAEELIKKEIGKHEDISKELHSGKKALTFKELEAERSFAPSLRDWMRTARSSENRPSSRSV